MNIVEAIIARLWSKIIYSNSCVYLAGKLSKIKSRMNNSYRGIKAMLVPDTQQDDRFDAVCQILIEKHNLKKLNSPFSGHSVFLYDGKHHIWEIDKTDTSLCEVRVKKPESTLYDQIMEFNEIPKSLIHKSIQKDQLTSMKV